MAAQSSAEIAAILVLIVTGCATPAQREALSAPSQREAPSAPLQPQAASAPQPTLAVVAPGPGDWATWSHDQKFAYMKTVFMEEARKLFTSWMPVRFRDMECRTCHGSIGVKNGTFRMPNPELPVVAPGPEGFKELAEHEPEVLRFMQSRLVPEAARLLGVPAFDFKTHRGFSCYQCHVRGQ